MTNRDLRKLNVQEIWTEQGLGGGGRRGERISLRLTRTLKRCVGGGRGGGQPK